MYTLGTQPILLRKFLFPLLRAPSVTALWHAAAEILIPADMRESEFE